MSLNRRTPNNRGPSQRLITFAALLLVALGLVVVGSRSGVLRPVVSALMAPLSPVTNLANGGTEAAESLAEGREDYEALLERNRELERTVAQMQAELAELREIERAFDRVADIADYAQANPDQTVVTADVIGQDTSSYLRTIIINRGTRDGVQVGDPVISGAIGDTARGAGFVGVVIDVSATAAWVRLASDTGSQINARMQNSRAEGTVVGLLQGGLRMQFIEQTALFEEGDVVLTSGLGGTLPANIVIGEVTTVRRQQGALFQEADIRPLVDFDDLEVVGVITTFQPIDTTIFEPEPEEAP